ncbi:hypothetical protein E4T46_06337 [Aureobasidium subglaciale]|nr:hypothetical protein E4T40_06537 [Aureobasidium subglaciale]KAI5260065.1 hypothetical protein E4T46_06337 [Aureobasidium subglaciale]
MATLTHPPQPLHAQTTTPVHQSLVYDASAPETRSTSTNPPSPLHDPSNYSHPYSHATPLFAMDDEYPPGEEQLFFAAQPPVLPPMNITPLDADMEGADDTAGRSPTWPPSVTSHLRNSPAHAPTTTINIVDVPSPIPEPLSSPVPPAALYSDTPPAPPALAPVPRPSAEDSEEEDEDDDDRSHISDERARSFYPFKEDKTIPDAEEVRIMQAYVENSALNDKHWHSRTFFDLQDPDFTPQEQGKIEWTIKSFNGTKDAPRKNLLLTSPTVSIGGYDWRIKLLPHGNMHTDRLSLYVENMTVQSSAQDEWPAETLALPVSSDAKVAKRRSVAAQVSIIVYNPEEPRVNEFRADASQFSKDSPDHGWTRFTSVPWYEIHRRSYAQRQPLLRNDTLAIKAFIRVIHDPTGCLWAAKDSQRELALTGLSPFYAGYPDSALSPVLALLLHLRPFRSVLYQLGDIFNAKEEDNILTVLQAMLWRMRSRAVSPHANSSVPLISEFLEEWYEDKGPQDAMQTVEAVINDMKSRLEKLGDTRTLDKLSQVLKHDHFTGDRLNRRPIVGKTSVQEVVDDGLPNDLLHCEVLTLELERQVFDTEKRCYKKLLDKVRLDDQVIVSGVTYTLYGFVAHEGHLRNGKYSSHFRPGGLGGLWYTYKHNTTPACQTKTQAIAAKEGIYPPEAVEEPVITSDRPISYDRLLGQVEAVAYVVIYLRDTVALDLATPEPWEAPSWIHKMYAPSTDTAESANNTLHYDDTTSGGDDDEEMNDASIIEEAPQDTLKQVTINYLSQPFYQGTINSASEYHGTGHLIHLSGDEYTGTFSHSTRTGHGKMTYANLDTYEGAWENDLPHGHGTHTSHRTGNIYTGNWLEGKKHGEGTTYWKCSEEENKLCRICFGEEACAAFYDCGHVYHSYDHVLVKDQRFYGRESGAMLTADMASTNR